MTQADQVPVKSERMAAAQYQRPYQRIAEALRVELRSGRWRPGDRLPTLEQLAREHDVAKNTVRNAVDLLRTEGLIAARGLTITDTGGDLYVPEPATTPEKQPVANAIVTSHLGVLGGRRNEGWWAFIGGEIEPGESATDAAIREVKEETGLEVRAGHTEIGRRVHPKTGRLMIYLACTPTAGTDVFVGDEDELAEVRWLSLAEVDTLMVGVFEPVRAHLERVIS